MSTTLLNETDSVDSTGAGRGPRVSESAAAQSLVGCAVKIGGDIYCQQDLFIDGEVTGTMNIPAHKLTIGPQARVKADIKAHNVVIVGNVEGKIEATERVELRGRCQLTGDVRSPRIMIENGAVIKGTVEVTRQPERGRTAPAPLLP
jgi:cytoskeletal protein CcmA (bactofilin family)